MEQFAITAEPELMKRVDEFIKENKLYSSRNDFVRESIREHLREVQRTKIREVFHEWAEEIKAKGKVPHLLSPEEKDEIAHELMKEKGLE